MQLAKLFKHLKRLNTEEQKLFERWLSSPFLCRNTALLTMFQFVRRSAPEYQGRRLDSKNIYSALFPGKPYKEVRIKQLSGFLLKQLYAFWLYQEQAKHQDRRDIELWSMLHAQKLDLESNRIKDKSERQLFVQLLQNDSANLLRHQFAQAQHQQILELGKRDQEPKLQTLNDTLDRFYFFEKLKHYSKALIQRKFSKQEYNFPLIDGVLDTVRKEPYQNLYGLQFYAYAVQALKSQEDQHYYRMKEILFKHTAELDTKELPEMLLVARNYCIQQLNNRESNFMTELFEIYQLEIDEDMIEVEGQIPTATYKNIATLSLLLKRYDWLENFLHEYKSSVKESSYFFNLALLRFSQQRYEEVIDLFEQAEYEEVLMNLSAKAWQLKTHFELWLKYPEDFEYEERLESFITAFTTFLNRKKSRLPQHYLFYLNLGKFAREMLRYSRAYQFDADELQKLVLRVKDTESVAERDWLVKKIRDLMLKSG